LNQQYIDCSGKKTSSELLEKRSSMALELSPTIQVHLTSVINLQGTK